MPLEISTTADGVRFSLRVQPGAGRDAIAGEYGQALKIRVAAPPVEGRANEAVQRFLAKCLNVSVAAVKIASGAHSRTKQVQIRGVTPDQIRALLASVPPK